MGLQPPPPPPPMHQQPMQLQPPMGLQPPPPPPPLHQQPMQLQPPPPMGLQPPPPPPPMHQQPMQLQPPPPMGPPPPPPPPPLHQQPVQLQFQPPVAGAYHPALLDFIPVGSEYDHPRQVVDSLGGASMQRALAALRPPPPMTPAGSWAGRELFEEFVPLDSDEAAEATLSDMRDLCVVLVHQGVRAVPGHGPRAVDYAEAGGRVRQMVTQATVARAQPAAAPAAAAHSAVGRAPDGTASMLETGTAADRKRDACVPMSRLFPLQRSEYIASEARASTAAAVRALAPAEAVARLANRPEPAGSAAFAYFFSSATTEDKASGSIAISHKVARGALVADLRASRLRGMGGQLQRNVTDDHKEELRVFFEAFMYGRVEVKALIRLYAWVMPDQDHSTLQNSLGGGRPGDPAERMDFQRAMPLAFEDMARVWGGAAGCRLGQDGVFGLRTVYGSLELDMEMPRIHAVFDDIFNGIFLVFARCRAVDGLNHTPAELCDAEPHRTLVGAYLRPDLVNVVSSYKVHTVEPVRKDQKLTDSVGAMVAEKMRVCAAGGSATAVAQVTAMQTQMQGMQREINTLKRGAHTQGGPPPPPPPGGPPQLRPMAAPPAAAPPPGSRSASPSPAQVPPPRDPGDFTVVAQDPVKLVERYEWALHKASKPSSCGWLSLFGSCRLGAAPPNNKRPCPRCFAGLTSPDKEAFLLVAASAMPPARAAEIEAIKAQRGWG